MTGRDPDEALRELLEPAGAADTLSRDELAERSGLPAVVIDALERERLLTPVEPGPPPRFAAGDLALLTQGMRLLEAGLPLGELLDLGRRTDAALRGLADHAVEVFARFVRDPVRADGDARDAGDRLAAAFRAMLPATGDLIAGHFQRLLLEAARGRLDEGPDPG